MVRLVRPFQGCCHLHHGDSSRAGAHYHFRAHEGRIEAHGERRQEARASLHVCRYEVGTETPRQGREPTGQCEGTESQPGPASQTEQGGGVIQVCCFASLRPQCTSAAFLCLVIHHHETRPTTRTATGQDTRVCRGTAAKKEGGSLVRRTQESGSRSI